VRKVLLEGGLQPAPKRTRSSWRAFLRQQAASVLACDFLTVETAFLQRIYVLFFISLATRRIEYVACTSSPNGRWGAQQARNLVMELGDEHALRFLVHDRDTKFSSAFDEVFRSEGFVVIRTPRPGTERERPCRTLGAHASRRLPRPHPHPRPVTSTTCSAFTAVTTLDHGHRSRRRMEHRRVTLTSSYGQRTCRTESYQPSRFRNGGKS